MNTHDGYKKLTLDNTLVLLAGGGHKPLSDFALSGDYVYRAGDTMTGILHMLANQYEDTANTGALDLSNSDIYGVNSIKFSDLSDAPAEGLQWYRDSTHVDTFWVKSGVMYFTPNRAWGATGTSYTVLHTGNIGLYTGGSGNITANTAQTNGSVYLTLRAGASYFKHNIVGATGISVTSDANGKITITGTEYSTTSHTHAFAQITNKITQSNEFNFLDSEAALIWFNYRNANDSAATTAISTYHFGSALSDGTYASVKSAGFVKNGSDDTYILLGGGGHTLLSDLASTHTHPYLPLAGGAMNDLAVITRTGKSVTWVNGRKYPLIKTTSCTGYNSILSMKTTNGSWDLGVYTNDIVYLTYITDTNYNNGTNTTTYQMLFPKKSGTIALTSDLSGYLTGQDHYKTSPGAGTAGTSSATSGSSLSIPYVTVNAAGHVTGYGTHTHTISGFATSGHNHDSEYVNISGDLMTGNLRRKLSNYTRGTAPSTRQVAAYPFVDANNVTSGWIEYDASTDGQTSIGMYVVTPRSSSNSSNIWTGFKVVKPATTWYGLYTMNYNVANGQLTVPAPSGTAPFVISSNEVVTNLNADLLDGNHASAFATSGHNHEILNLTNFSSRVYDATISRTKNTVLAAPNGSNGAASFRALVAADIPTLTMSKISDAPSTKALTINGTAYNVYTSLTSLPTILAPTGYGTANYILATNASGNGLTWVAKPTSNVSTAAYVSSSSTGKAQITAAQSDPYYNLVEGSTVNRSIQFKAGTGMSISSSTGGVITFTNSTASTLNTISSYLAVTVSGDVVTFPVFDSDGNFAGWENSEISIQSGSFYKTTLNNTERGDPYGTSLGSWYAPTSGGTSGQVLKSAGSTSTPEWQDPGSFIAELYVPRVTESADNVPGLNRFRVREHTAGTTYNLPTNNSYHIYTTAGFSSTLATELAIPMTDTSALYVRSKTSSVWRPWVRLLDGDPASMTGNYLLDKSDLFTTTNFYPGNRLYGLPGANITINPGSGSDSTTYSSTSLGTDNLKKLMTMWDYSFRFANKTPSSTTTVALYDGLLIIIDVGDFSSANSLIYGTIRAIYVFGANCGHVCTLTIDTQACNASTWTNIVNSQLKGWAGPNIYWINPFIIGGYTGLTSRVRKIRIRSYISSINSSYTKEIPRIGGLGLIGDKPYIAPSNIAVNNHLYTVNLDMTGVFPSYVQSTGFKVAGKNDTHVLLAGGGTAALSSIGGGGSITTTSTSFNSQTTLKILFYTDPTNGGNISTVHYNTNFYVNNSGVFYSSDRNLKTNIKDYSTFIKDNPIKLFDWKDGTGKDNIGFIAQELEEWCPQAVGTNEDGRKTVNYKTALSALCSFLYNKIKDLEDKLDKLEKEKA